MTQQGAGPRDLFHLLSGGDTFGESLRKLSIGCEGTPSAFGLAACFDKIMGAVGMVLFPEGVTAISLVPTLVAAFKRQGTSTSDAVTVTAVVTVLQQITNDAYSQFSIGQPADLGAYQYYIGMAASLSMRASLNTLTQDDNDRIAMLFKPLPRKTAAAAAAAAGSFHHHFSKWARRNHRCTEQPPVPSNTDSQQLLGLQQGHWMPQGR